MNLKQAMRKPAAQTHSRTLVEKQFEAIRAGVPRARRDEPCSAW